MSNEINISRQADRPALRLCRGWDCLTVHEAVAIIPLRRVGSSIRRAEANQNEWGAGHEATIRPTCFNRSLRLAIFSVLREDNDMSNRYSIFDEVPLNKYESKIRIVTLLPAKREVRVVCCSNVMHQGDKFHYNALSYVLGQRIHTQFGFKAYGT